MTQILKELVGYGAASAFALLVDLAILWALVHFRSWEYVPAATTSFLIGSVVAYHLCTTIAFKQHRLTNRRAEFAIFVVIGSIGLLVNGTVIFIGANLLGVNYLIAKCIAAGFTFACNFVVRRQLLFVSRASD